MPYLLCAMRRLWSSQSGERGELTLSWIHDFDVRLYWETAEGFEPLGSGLLLLWHYWRWGVMGEQKLVKRRVRVCCWSFILNAFHDSHTAIEYAWLILGWMTGRNNLKECYKVSPRGRRGCYWALQPRRNLTFRTQMQSIRIGIWLKNWKIRQRKISCFVSRVFTCES